MTFDVGNVFRCEIRIGHEIHLHVSKVQIFVARISNILSAIFFYEFRVGLESSSWWGSAFSTSIRRSTSIFTACLCLRGLIISQYLSHCVSIFLLLFYCGKLSSSFCLLICKSGSLSLFGLKGCLSFSDFCILEPLFFCSLGFKLSLELSSKVGVKLNSNWTGITSS